MSGSQEYDPPIQSKQVRAKIRREADRYTVQRALYEVDGSVKTALMKLAFDEYDELPTSATQIYDPDAHRIIIDLPPPENREVSLDDF